MNTVDRPPLSKLKSVTNGRFRNILCPCGSGRKAKKCCLPKMLVLNEPTVLELRETEKRSKYTNKQYKKAMKNK
jgi:hypothetical protein